MKALVADLPTKHHQRFSFQSALPDPKSRTFGITIPANHDVLRLDIAVDNASLMRRRKPFRHLHADLQDRIELQRFFTREMLTQGLAVDQLGRDIVFAVYVTDLIDGQNVWMIQRRSSLGFLDKTAQLVRIFAEFFVGGI